MVIHVILSSKEWILYRLHILSIQNNFTNSFTPPPLRIKCSYSESGLVFFSTFIYGIFKRSYHTMHNHSNLSDCSPLSLYGGGTVGSPYMQKVFISHSHDKPCIVVETNSNSSTARRWTIGVSKWFFGNGLENECPVYRCGKLTNPHCSMAMSILSILKSKIWSS